MNKCVSAAAAAAIAGGVIATPAYAAESVWDKVAYCESTNNWSINTGNGFYGGLQFTISTWNEFGGQEFADRADHATRAEQILVARRTLAVQGPGAWPKCSIYAGLTRQNGGAVSMSIAQRAVPATPAKAAAESKPKRAIPAVPAKPKRAIEKHAEYTAQPGDTLIQIARDHGLGEDWKAIFTLNEAEIENPDLIYVGQRFILD